MAQSKALAGDSRTLPASGTSTVSLRSRTGLQVAVCGALLPVFADGSASANNDTALFAVGAASFYVWLRGLRELGYDRFLLKAGALIGLGLLAKLTMLALVPAFALVVLFRALQ